MSCISHDDVLDTGYVDIDDDDDDVNDNDGDDNDAGSSVSFQEVMPAAAVSQEVCPEKCPARKKLKP